jgi:hypothetical protein
MSEKPWLLDEISKVLMQEDDQNSVKPKNSIKNI